MEHAAKMKKQFAIIIALLILTAAVALAQIELSIPEYDSDTNRAKIKIKNTGSERLYDLKIVIDDTNTIPFLENSFLEPSKAVLVPIIISPGTHKMEVTSRKGIEIEKLFHFGKSTEMIEKELEEQKEAIKEEQETQREIAKKLEDKPYVKDIEPSKEQELTPEEIKKIKKERKFNLTVTIIIAVLLIILIAYIIITRKGKPKKIEPITPQQRAIQKPRYTPPQIRGLPRRESTLKKKRETVLSKLEEKNEK